jgi:hypothetical protein
MPSEYGPGHEHDAAGLADHGIHDIDWEANAYLDTPLDFERRPRVNATF